MISLTLVIFGFIREKITKGLKKLVIFEEKSLKVLKKLVIFFLVNITLLVLFLSLFKVVFELYNVVFIQLIV